MLWGPPSDSVIMQAFLANNQMAGAPMVMVPVMWMPYSNAAPYMPTALPVDLAWLSKADDQQAVELQPCVKPLSCKKVQRKLQNKRMDKAEPIAPDVNRDTKQAASVLAASFAAKKSEQMLRLALAALGDKTSCLDDMTERTASTGLDSSSLTTRTMSLLDETASSANESLLDASAASVPLPGSSLHKAREPRIGIDIGGVLLTADMRRCSTVYEVPGGLSAIRIIADIFGARNVFLVSKVRLGGRMHQRTQQWLSEPDGFLEKSGIPPGNVVFVSAINGVEGKGVAAARLGLSHFIDDKSDVLESVFADKAGNSGDLVRQFDGILFHFATGGIGRWKPKAPIGMSRELASHYCPASGWSDVLRVLRRDSSPRVPPEVDELKVENQHATSAATMASVVLVHRVSVGIEEDGVFGVVRRLTGANDENFKYISGETGAKLVLNGRGSTHPQANSFKEEALTICIRAKTSGSLEKAAALVEELLHAVCMEHQEMGEMPM